MTRFVSITFILTFLVAMTLAERKYHTMVGGPFFSEFLEEDDGELMVELPKMKSSSRRSMDKDENKKTKTVSTKNVKRMDDKTAGKDKKPGWFASLSFDDLTESLE